MACGAKKDSLNTGPYVYHLCSMVKLGEVSLRLVYQNRSLPHASREILHAERGGKRDDEKANMG